MSNPRKTGTIFFASVIQAALFEHEFKGQMSDGMWGDSLPHEHWKFWCRLDVKVCHAGETPRVAQTGGCISKRSYDFARLIADDDVLARMLAIGRMARGLLATGVALETFARSDLRCTVDYMPPTLEEWRQCKETGEWKYDFIDDFVNDFFVPYTKLVTDELAQAFYAATYTEKELRRDIKAIREAMANVVFVDERLA